jgi:hypothetical protein
MAELDGDGAWECKGGSDKSRAERILGSIPDIDIPATLAFFEQHGGYCDCEIVANVEDNFEWESKADARMERASRKLQEKRNRDGYTR